MLVGLFHVLSTHEYPPGDIRGGFWIVLGGAVMLMGAVILVSTVRDVRRARSDRRRNE